jgi:hypothetical protein
VTPPEADASKPAEQANDGELMLKREFEQLTGASIHTWGESQQAMVRGGYDLHFAVTAKSLALLSMLCGSYHAQDHDGSVLLGLTTQMFNSASAAMTLLMTGYYQQSFTVQRHMVETGNLLDLFRTDKLELQEWLKYQNSLNTQGFRPTTVMEKLDTRDGLPDGSRLVRYRVISNLATHPNAIGLRIVQHQGAWAVGPSFNEMAFKSALEELGWYLPYFTLVAMETLPGAKDCVPEEANLTYHMTLASWQQRCHRTTVVATGPARLTEYAGLLWGRSGSDSASAPAEPNAEETPRPENA